MSQLIDNRGDNILSTHVNALLEDSTFSRMAVGFFYLSGFEAIREKLNNIQNLRLLIGNRSSQRTVEEMVKGHLGEQVLERELRSQARLNKKQKAEIIAETANNYLEDTAYNKQDDKEEFGLSALWEMIREKRIEVRVYTKGTLHSKAYLFEAKPNAHAVGTAIVGSSNLSISGLSNNSELNVKVNEPNFYKETVEWFDRLWEESEPFSETLMNVVEESWVKKQVTPYEIYIKTLYNLVKDRIEIKKHTSSLTGFDESKLYPFQLDAYNRAIDILESGINPSQGIFISDVVGLGKSFIAIALIKYYWSIKRKRSLIICPASLKSMWKDYKEDYNLRCTILSSSELRFRNGNQNWDLSRDESYDGYGVVVIDESHNFRNEKAQKYQVLAPYLANRKVIMLTATPQNSSVWDIYHQIKLFHPSEISDYNISPNNLKEYFKENEENPEKIAELLQNILIRRTRKDIQKNPRYREWCRKNKFPKRQLNTLTYSLEDTYDTQTNKAIYDRIIEKMFDTENKNGFGYAIYDLTGYLKDENKEDKEYIDLSNIGDWARGLLKVLFFKRLESSVASFYKSIERSIRRHDIISEAIGRGVIITGSPDQLELFLDDDNPRQAKVNDYPAEDFDTEKLLIDIAHDRAVLLEVLSLVGHITEEPSLDAKLQVLIKDVIQKHPKKKILIFSEFSDTVRYLHENTKSTVGSRRSHFITSQSASSEQKAEIVARFSPISQKTKNLVPEEEIDILFTTDVLSEGQNLQDCDIVVNYDFHWNPVRLIQRIGRVDRIGSTSDLINVYNFLPDTRIEEQLDLQGRVQARVNEIHKIFGLDSKVLSDDTYEEFNEHSVFAIYSDRNENILEAEDSIQSIYDRAELELEELKANSPEEYQRIINIKDGVRTARKAERSGTYAYFSSGNFYKLYYKEGEKVTDNIADIIEIIRAAPEDPKPVSLDSSHHNKEMKLLYSKFESELNKREATKSAQIQDKTQKHFIKKLENIHQDMFLNEQVRKMTDELRTVFSREIPSYALRDLRRLRDAKLEDTDLITALREIVDHANILGFQKKDDESQALTIRTICSEGFV